MNSMFKSGHRPAAWRRLSIAFYCILFTQSLTAQKVMSISGGIQNQDNYLMEFSVGQVFLESPNHLNYISSEGVLNPQPKRIVFDSPIDFAVFPNPTRDFFDLHFTNPNEITRVLIKNNQGIILKEFSSGFEKFKTDLKFAPGVYYITVMTPRNQKTKTIIKL